MVKQAFILGAGFGSRMRPLTDHTPKPLIVLTGKPMIDHVIDRLVSVGVEKIVINVHYLADKLETHLRQNNKAEIIISDERDLLLDTGGGVKKALSHFGDEPFFIHNSDSTWIEQGHNNLADMIRNFSPGKMDNLLCLANRHSSIGYSGKGDFELSEQGLISRKQPGETTDHVFIGVSIATINLFDNSPDGPFSLNVLWDQAIARGRLHGQKHHGIWMHVGTTEALTEAEHCIKTANQT